jgi:hypothetical protein
LFILQSRFDDRHYQCFQQEQKYDSIIFSVNPCYRYSVFLRERCSMFLIEAPTEQPIHATSLGLKLHDTKPTSPQKYSICF